MINDIHPFSEHCECKRARTHATPRDDRTPRNSWLPSLGSTARACDRGGGLDEGKRSYQLLTLIERRNYSRGREEDGRHLSAQQAKVTESRFRCCCVALRLRQLPSQVGSSRFQAHFTPLNPRSSRGYTSFFLFFLQHRVCFTLGIHRA